MMLVRKTQKIAFATHLAEKLFSISCYSDHEHLFIVVAPSPLHRFFIGYWILNGAGFLSRLFYLQYPYSIKAVKL
jgi:hypothetical protein